MAGTLTVQNIEGPSSGSDANKVIIPSGQTLDVSGGTFTPSADQVLQYKYGTTNTYTAFTTTSFAATNLQVSITPKSASSILLLHVTTACWWSTSAPSANYIKLTIYKDGSTNIFDGLQYDSGVFVGNAGSRDNYDKPAAFSGTYTHGGSVGTSQTYKLYGGLFTASNEGRVNPNTANNIIHCWEIAQ